MSNKRTSGGLYRVTLNNETPISVNAGDHRVAHRAIQVRRGDIKVGRSENLTRRHGDYIRTFGRDNVNFCVLAYIPGGKSDRDRAESVVFECFRSFRIRGTTGRLNEWMTGVSASDARAMALEALRDSGIEHLVVPEEGEGSADVSQMAVVGQTRPATDGIDDIGRGLGAMDLSSPAGRYVQRSVMPMDVQAAYERPGKHGVSALDGLIMVLEAFGDSGTPQEVALEEGEDAKDVPPITVSGQICPAKDRTDDASCVAGVTASDTPAGSYAEQTMAYMDVLEAHNVLDDQTFKRLHHLASAKVNGHRAYCASLVANGSDFHQSRTGEKNRNVCRRLGLIANALSARVPPVSRAEIEALIQEALRAYPL